MSSICIFEQIIKFEIMKSVLGNFAFLFGIIGFVMYVLLILASFFGCCSAITTDTFQKIVMFILGIAVITFLICMYNNCCNIRKKNKSQ